MKLDKDGKVIEMEIEGVNYTHIDTYIERNEIKVHRTNFARKNDTLRLKGSVFVKDEK